MWSAPDQLDALSAVVREGSFERAAAALSLTTSAVSQRVKALESSAGRVLLRRQRPVTATAAGQVLLKLAQQLELLEQDALRDLELNDEHTPTVPISVNADSLKTWLLPALVGAARDLGFALDVRREDQDSAARLLREGEVMAAITSNANAVQGCSVTPLGAARYMPVASDEFRQQWFAGSITAASLRSAPTVVYDRTDRLLDRFLERHAPGKSAPRNYIPGSWDYLRAIELGLGWGIAPHPIAAPLIQLSTTWHIDSPLYWHQWSLPSTHLAALRTAAAHAAKGALHPIIHPVKL
jgi:LysR family transcriptional regulator, chromosome initiation inhibitor